MKPRSVRACRRWLTLLFVALCACVKANEGSAGSETHFLSNCKASCPAPYSCSCGVCTLPCTSDGVCGSLLAEATCRTSSEVERSCRAERRVCDVQCSVDTECRGLGEGFGCRDGQCRELNGGEALISDAFGEPRPLPAPEESTAFKRLALGSEHGCALRNDGQVYCWGANFFGQLGRPLPAREWVGGDARAVEGLSDVQKLYSGSSSSCSIDGSGQTSCWGQIFLSQSDASGGYGSSANERVLPLAGLDGVLDMSIGEAFHCALLNTDVRCWGLNQLGQLGDGTREGRAGPESAHAISESVMPGATQIASGTDHSCGLDLEGKVWCWGSDLLRTEAQALPSDQESASLVDVADVAKVDVGAKHACALRRRGPVSCWGDNSVGQLGNGSARSAAAPVAVLEIRNAVDIALAGNRSCALLSSGRISCWGENLNDLLGTGAGGRERPALVLGLDDAYALDVGDTIICALSRSRGLLCWGSNEQMQVGDGTREPRTRPTPVIVVD